MHPLVRLAWSTIEHHIAGKKNEMPEGLEEFRDQRAGVFVSIKKHGELRGCIGTFEPMTESVVEETVQNAVSAATRDPRFPSVEAEELGELSISVDVLTSPEPVDDAGKLDPRVYGVIVRKGHRRGLLLPDLEGVDTVGQQLYIACMKAGIDPADKDISISKFEVKRYR